MNKIALQNFISKLDFISMTENCIQNININTETNIITGIIELGNSEEIFFETNYIQTEDILEFKTKYQINNQNISDVLEEINTFIIAKPQTKSLFSPKVKYLLHLVNDNLNQAYIVNKKYNFGNGISENYTKLNMNNKDVLKNIPNYQISSINKNSRK